MKLLLDSCLSSATANQLREHGFDVLWSGDWTSDPGDPAILARANAEGRVMITLDKDYGELAVLHEQPHAGIIRLVDIAAREHAARCVRTIERYRGALELGAIVTVEVDRTRVRIDEAEDD